MDEHPGEHASYDAVGPALRNSLRERARQERASSAAELRSVAQLVGLMTADAGRPPAPGGQPGVGPDDAQEIRSAAVAKVAKVLGLDDEEASELIDLALRLTQTLTDTLTALEQGRIDLFLVQALSEATNASTDQVARQVEATMLALIGDGQTKGFSADAWLARLDREVVTADPDAARARRETALADREVPTWLDRDGTGILQMRASIEDITMVEEVITDLANASPTHDQHGNELTMDERRVEVVMDIIRRVRDGS